MFKIKKIKNVGVLSRLYIFWNLTQWIFKIEIWIFVKSQCKKNHDVVICIATVVIFFKYESQNLLRLTLELIKLIEKIEICKKLEFIYRIMRCILYCKCNFCTICSKVLMQFGTRNCLEIIVFLVVL